MSLGIIIEFSQWRQIFAAREKVLIVVHLTFNLLSSSMSLRQNREVTLGVRLWISLNSKKRNWDIEEMEQNRMASSCCFFCLAGTFLIVKEIWRCDCINAESFCMLVLMFCTQFTGLHLYCLIAGPIHLSGSWTSLILVSLCKNLITLFGAVRPDSEKMVSIFNFFF